MITTVKTNITINKDVAGNPPTAKQICWLKNAVKDYGFNINIENIASVEIASRHITQCQIAINTKKVVPVAQVKSIINYCIIVIDDIVSIKTFIHLDSAEAKYGKNVRYITLDAEYAKQYATELRASILEGDGYTYSDTYINEQQLLAKQEVAVEKIVTEADLKKLNEHELWNLAKELGVNLGRSKKQSTIIARILAYVA